MSEEKRNYRIGVIGGDGIGPEIVRQAVRVLDRAGEKYGFAFGYVPMDLGGCSIEKHGIPLTEETVALAKKCDAVLMGSIGGDPKTSPWYRLEPSKRPEAGLLGIRKALGLFANLRFSTLYDDLKDACPLREDIANRGFDMVVVRELTGGIYFGQPK